ncbi:protein-L-isoaspartate(D-aspartate) O-methyltransferase [Bosea sp. BH3]|uniref:protein-L-isoaspartate(D-aspartate) O-methyltransferase n=1 Tax=Bosea sp. BH3 TaxID=2871701 RepID=UPI0021CAE878|nr:protein-L-isoaspartate(D-aspartate) O-methyltransferase [Bosea sp. BH3]MCU4179503.1 protein-L-isoaspartate(D-aspartate) O-methyltransferase [Bosea sp. BH3]
MALGKADFERARAHMVETQIAGRGVRDPRLLDAMRQVPREAFVAEGYEELAFEDAPLTIGEGQTISQPYVVALMMEAAETKVGDVALEVGAGSGYAAAVLGRLVARVFAIERHRSLAEEARRRLKRLGCDNIELRCGDGTRGWPEAAPFDVILVSAGAPKVPEALKEQLVSGGRLIIPVGRHDGHQRLLKITRCGAADSLTTDLGAVSFVPLVGEQA